MNSEKNPHLWSWLAQLNGKTINKILCVDYNNRQKGVFMPWRLFILFTEFNEFIEIAGDFDGEHIKALLRPNFDLDKTIEEHDLPNEPDLWRVYDGEHENILANCINKKINSIEFGIDKEMIQIKDEIRLGEKDVLTFIKFIFDEGFLTIYEGGVGLAFSDKPNKRFIFEDTFDRYTTKEL